MAAAGKETGRVGEALAVSSRTCETMEGGAQRVNGKKLTLKRRKKGSGGRRLRRKVEGE